MKIIILKVVIHVNSEKNKNINHESKSYKFWKEEKFGYERKEQRMPK